MKCVYKVQCTQKHRYGIKCIEITYLNEIELVKYIPCYIEFSIYWPIYFFNCNRTWYSYKTFLDRFFTVSSSCSLNNTTYVCCVWCLIKSLLTFVIKRVIVHLAVYNRCSYWLMLLFCCLFVCPCHWFIFSYAARSRFVHWRMLKHKFC